MTQRPVPARRPPAGSRPQGLVQEGDALRQQPVDVEGEVHAGGPAGGPGEVTAGAVRRADPLLSLCHCLVPGLQERLTSGPEHGHRRRTGAPPSRVPRSKMAAPRSLSYLYVRPLSVLDRGLVVH
ncbi:hypothetical protein NDU88_013286 [Pleurodeles waltl]|uniref:Uncharacterized protein n=1 Tax=Pleurodeles waltl TaxID=8319 RepID=A0AAV7R8I8_PLEWA|nr:hypothetical protein NDU88_013286 [Pleurodeles waltl]